MNRPLRIAIAAMGGQGGGVLSDWIVDIAEQGGYFAQCTSVPGVAQRTGATVYYLEVYPRDGGRMPVMALMPVPGDVDLVIAGELMEAGRAVLRGLITRDRTTVVASTHRDYALTEKMAMGDGRASSERVIDATRASAARLIAFDMQSLAEQSGSVISSVLLGAVAASGVLPFDRAAFEDAVRRGGVAVDASLAAFAAGYERACAEPEPDRPAAGDSPAPVQPAHPRVLALIQRINGEFAEASRATLINGIRRLIDYQDPDYASEYLDRLAPVQSLDRQLGADNRLTTETARHLALWMSYEDTIRVADLKTRQDRFDRCFEEVHAKPGQIVNITEFMHPRLQEICDTLPAGLGKLVLENQTLRRLVGSFCKRGRRIRTTSLTGFLLLYFISALRPLRRRSLRYRMETAEITSWLDQLLSLARDNRALALEFAACQSLVKGYGDTHERGMQNFHSITAALDRVRNSSDPAATLRRLREAALADEQGDMLRDTLKEVA